MPLDLIAFIPFAAAMIGTPGPANIVLMAAGARFGARRTLPLMCGVILGKQFIIWPLGFGLIGLAASVPLAFAVLKYASVAYLIWLAWRVARLRINRDGADAPPPGFFAGLIVHPMNPKAWAMTTTVLTNYVDPTAGAFAVTAVVALGLLAVQCVLQPFYMLAGDRMARAVAGGAAEPWIMRGLAAAMVLSIIYVLVKGA